MRLASFHHRGRDGFGVVHDDRIVDLSGQAPSLREALDRFGLEGLVARANDGPPVPLGEIRWRPPVPDAGKILCVGLNYFEHAKEAKLEVPKKPSLFVRFNDSQVGHREPVVRPRASHQFDYEAELAFVIGRTSRHVAEADAMEHVAGYACFAENSVRDWQTHSRQATPGKNFAHSGAFGPWLVTPDEAGDPGAMEVVGRLNGREMQRDRVANMIFSIPQMLAYITTFTMLVPGDVVVTGTPAGVGFTRTPPVWLTPGDRFEVEITGLGTLSNDVIDEPAPGR